MKICLLFIVHHQLCFPCTYITIIDRTKYFVGGRVQIVKHGDFRAVLALDHNLVNIFEANHFRIGFT